MTGTIEYVIYPAAPGEIAHIHSAALTDIFGTDTTGAWGADSFGALIRHIFHYGVDTAFIASGFPGRTITPFAKPHSSVQTDRDTLWIGVGSDTTGGVEYFHVGASAAWADADSVKTFIY